MRFKGDIIIIDLGNVAKSEEDWQLCRWGENMEALGFDGEVTATVEQDSFFITGKGSINFKTIEV